MIYDLSGELLLDVYNVNGMSIESAYDLLGDEIFSNGGGGGGDDDPINKYKNYTIEMMPYTTPCGQDFTYYDGKIVACTDDNYLVVLNATTGARLSNEFETTVGHANSMVFSDEFYDENDTFPLLCLPGNNLRYFRVANTYDSAEVVKSYAIQRPSVDTSVNLGYALGFHDGYYYAAGYTSGSYQQASNNFILIAKYDLKNPIDNGDGTYTLPLLYTKRREWFECIQGSEIHDGFFWMNSGFTNPGHVYALDLTNANILLDIPIGDYTSLEMEALTWENDYTLIVSSKNQGSNTGMYKITFTDLVPVAG